MQSSQPHLDDFFFLHLVFNFYIKNIKMRKITKFFFNIQNVLMIFTLASLYILDLVRYFARENIT